MTLSTAILLGELGMLIAAFLVFRLGVGLPSSKKDGEDAKTDKTDRHGRKK